MINYKSIAKIALPAVMLLAGCTKLDEHLENSLSSAQAASALGASGVGLLLQSAYNDLATTGVLGGQDQLFSLQENATDESLVPTRGGDWDDNGVWRVIHNHTWNADHGQILSVFNNLNKINFDATNVLGFNPSKSQAAEARFLRAFALYHLLDLYGQFPIRNPGDNLLNPPTVRSGSDAITFIISELTAALADVSSTNGNTLASPDAIRFLLMRCYLNKGMFINRSAPTFDAGDMNQVITLGTAIMNSGKYSYSTNYFDNFAPNNGSISKETIFAVPATSGNGTNNAGMAARWNMTLHYNSYTPNNPNAGWNGFSTISDFYTSFGANGFAMTKSTADSVVDRRIGQRFYTGTEKSGIRPGFLIGQQFNESGVAEKDRKGNPLAFDPNIASNMIETGSNLEVTGIRVIKYVPDYNAYGGPAGNWNMLFRYADAVLMVAEAQMRSGATAAGLANVTALRTARGALVPSAATFTLVNTSNVDDPNTLLAERGRELYWESVRRTDLLRFGVFTKVWQYKPTDDAHYQVYPIPNQALAANPNLKQNAGY